MRKIYLLLIFFPLISLAQKLEGQKLIDSLLVELPKAKHDTTKISIYNQLGAKYIYDHEELTIKYSKMAIALSEKIKFNKGLTYAHLHLGNLNILRRDYKKAITEYSIGMKSANTPNLKALIYMGFAVNYFYDTKYPKAIEYNFLALKQFELANDEKNILKTMRNIGQLYLQTEQFESAIKIYEKCLKLNKEKQLLDVDCNIIHEIGFCYSKLNKNKIAKIKFNQALALCPDDKELVGCCYVSFGDIDQQESKFTSANVFYKKAIALFTEIDDIVNYTSVLCNYSKNNLELSKIEINPKQKANYLQIAIASAKESLIKGKDISDLITVSELNNTLSEAYKLQGNYKESLAAHEQYVIYKDSVFNSENKETIKNLEDKREIELRDKEIKINKLSLEAKEKQKWLFVAGIGFLLIIGGLLFYQSRKRKQVNLKLETLNHNLDQANKAKTRFFSILNHDLRGPVANLIFFLQLQNESPEMLDAASTKRMQDKTMTGAENLLASMEDILQWSKSQMENFKPQPKKISVNQLFNDTKKVFSGYLKITFEYQNPNDIEIFTDENYLKTIVRNLTSNAINVFTDTQNPLIVWKAWQTGNQSFLSVNDNGPGASDEKFNALFDEAEIGSTKSGLGLHLIRDMAKAINCDISVESKLGEGTTFVLKL